MYLNLAPGDIGIKLPLSDLIPLAERHNFEGIDLPVERIEEGLELPEPELESRMADAGLRWGSFNAGWDFAADKETYERRVELLEKCAPIAQRLGCTRATTGACPGHDELDYDANFKLHVDRLSPIAHILADNGIRLGLEFIGPKTRRDEFRHPFIHALPQMLDLLAAIAPLEWEESVGVLLDSYHWYLSGGTEQELMTLLDNQRIVVVHVNDGVAGRSADEQMDLERTLPLATGIIDAATFTRCLRALHYDGPVTVEPFDAALSALPADEAAARTAAAATAMLELGAPQ